MDTYIYVTIKLQGFLGGSDDIKRLSAMQETRVRSLGCKDPLEKEMAAHSSILAWRIPIHSEPVCVHARLLHSCPTLCIYIYISNIPSKDSSGACLEYVFMIR